MIATPPAVPPALFIKPAQPHATQRIALVALSLGLMAPVPNQSPTARLNAMKMLIVPLAIAVTLLAPATNPITLARSSPLA